MHYVRFMLHIFTYSLLLCHSYTALFCAVIGIVLFGYVIVSRSSQDNIYLN